MKPLTYLVLLFLLFSCKKNDETDQNVNSSKQKGNLVLYFKEIPENWKFSKEGGSYVHKGRHEVSYTQNLITKTWSPDYSKKIDTLVIKIIDDDLELVHK